MEASFKYRNHRGDIEQRTIDVDCVEWLAKPGFDYQPGWFISGMCHDRKARRSFALSHIVMPYVTQSARLFRVPHVPQEKPALPTQPKPREKYVNAWRALDPAEYVPKDQTPLTQDLTHPLLDAVRAGEKSRDTGQPGTYHGHSLEHCLHSVGWVLRDLRIALDKAKVDLAAEREKKHGTKEYESAVRLLLAIAKKNFPARDISPLPDTEGVLSQIDNVTSLLVPEVVVDEVRKQRDAANALLSHRDKLYEDMAEKHDGLVRAAADLESDLAQARRERDEQQRRDERLNLWGASRFCIGDRVAKVSGSSWRGKVVGFYSTTLTPVGIAVESENEPGSVQIYPEAALEKR